MDSREVALVRSFRGSKSRNKVSVGEPAEGSLSVYTIPSGSAVADKSNVRPVHERSERLDLLMDKPEKRANGCSEVYSVNKTFHP